MVKPSELLRERESRFISVYDLVSLLSKSENIGLGDAAKIVILVLEGGTKVPTMGLDINGISDDSKSAFFEDPGNLLTTIANCNKFASDEGNELAGVNNYIASRAPFYFDWYLGSGWDRVAMVAAFNAKGIDLFFDEKSTQEEASLDKKHTCYPNKLSAAIAAWEAVTTDAKYKDNGKSPKANIIHWLTENAEQYGLVKSDGAINKNAIENQIAKVVNWDEGGGTPTTPNK